MYCPYCKTELGPNAVLCPVCGAHVAEEWQMAQGDSAQSNENPTRTKDAKDSVKPPEIAERRTRPKDYTIIDPGSSAKPSPEDAPPSDTGKSKKTFIIVAVAAAAVVVAAILGVLAISLGGKQMSPYGAISGRTYNNPFYDLSLTLKEGFAFATEDETEILFDSGMRYLENDADTSDFDPNAFATEDDFRFDAVAYNPFSNEYAVVMIIPGRVPKDLADETILDAAVQGMAVGLKSSNLVDNTGVSQTIIIGDKECPYKDVDAARGSIKLTLRVVLVREGDYVAALFVAGTSNTSADGICQSFSHCLDPNARPSEETDAISSADSVQDDKAYVKGTIKDNVYTNERVGFTVTLSEDFTQADSPLDPSIQDNPFGAAQVELMMQSQMTGEMIVIMSTGLPPSYAETYTDEEVGRFAIPNINTDSIRNQFKKAGATQTELEKTTVTIDGREVPTLLGTHSISGVSVFTGDIILMAGPQMISIEVTCFDQSRVPELLNTITFN